MMLKGIACYTAKVLILFIFIRKAPTRWLPRTSCSYDQREGSEEPPSGFADVERRIVSDRRYKLSICVKSENHSFRLVVHTATRRATSHTVPADTGLNTLYASVL